jgi:hypothetical protein
MDLSTSKAFQAHRPGVLGLNEEDVVPVTKVASDSLWHGVSAYIGVNLRCKRCGSDFTFSAREQKVWREDYGFSIHSYPIHCRTCRAVEREVGALRKRLSLVLSTKIFSQKDFDELIDVADALILKGRIDLLTYKLKQKVFWAAKQSLHPRRAEVVTALKR